MSKRRTRQRSGLPPALPPLVRHAPPKPKPPPSPGPPPMPDPPSPVAQLAEQMEIMPGTVWDIFPYAASASFRPDQRPRVYE